MADGDFSLDDGFISRLFQIESGGDPSAITGSNRGLGQFSPDLERRYGITDWRDPGQQTAAVHQEMNEFAPSLAKTLGRAPTSGELYLAHQQGLAGAQAHFNNPDGTAWQNIRPYYSSDRVARAAIWGNIPDNARISPSFNKTMFPGGVDDVRSSDFTNGWITKFEGSPGVGGSSLSAMVANKVPAGVSASVPVTGGMLAGTDAIAPQDNNYAASIGRIANLFNQPMARPAPARFKPIQMAVPAGINAQLIAAALRNKGLT